MTISWNSQPCWVCCNQLHLTKVILTRVYVIVRCRPPLQKRHWSQWHALVKYFFLLFTHGGGKYVQFTLEWLPFHWCWLLKCYSWHFRRYFDDLDQISIGFHSFGGIAVRSSFVTEDLGGYWSSLTSVGSPFRMQSHSNEQYNFVLERTWNQVALPDNIYTT